MPKVGKVKLVIGILSCAKFKKRQNYLRKTWGAECQKRGIEYYFIMGRPGQPAEIVHDQLYVDAGDYYEDLPRKSYEFVKFCFENLDFDWLFKTDDDVYVRFPRFLKTELSGDYCGNIVCKRGMKGVWHQGKCHDQSLNKVKYQGGHYGPWCGGPGYFLSRRACEVIAQFVFNQKDMAESSAEETTKAWINGELYEDKMIGDILRMADIKAVKLSKYYRNIHRVDQLREMPKNRSVLHLDLKDKKHLKTIFQQIHARDFPVRIGKYQKVSGRPTRRKISTNRTRNKK